MSKYDTIMTREFFEQHTDLSSSELQKLLKAEYQLDISDRIVRMYRQKHGLGWAPPKQALPQATDKVVRKPFDVNTSVKMYYEMLRSQREQLQAKQQTVTIMPPDKNKYLGVAIIGDLHLGSEYIDEERLFDEQQLIRETANCVAVQVGDICNNEGSYATRIKSRCSPAELPLDIQRALAIDYFTLLKDKMIAFIIGNHDYRSLITEEYDFGEVLVDKIVGAYLGFSGNVIIDYGGHTYKIHLTHEGNGFSQINPTHPGIRIAKDDHTLDVVCFGHIHDDVAFIDMPIGANTHRTIAIRAGGYMVNPSPYTELNNFNTRPITTPLLILSPDKKYIRVERDIYEGVKTLRALNGE